MKKIVFFLLFGLISISCGGSKKNNTSSTKSSYTSTRKTPKKIKSIIAYAKTFEGTKYKYGGTTKRGMDCSGLLYTSFKKEEIILPRTSAAMAKQGKLIPFKKIAIGDLLFFRTNPSKKTITHVGLVIEAGAQIKFIHASSSKGVTTSSLEENYWKKCYAHAKRLL